MIGCSRVSWGRKSKALVRLASPPSAVTLWRNEKAWRLLREGLERALRRSDVGACGGLASGRTPLPAVPTSPDSRLSCLITLLHDVDAMGWMG